ncbi:hypothetical protein BJ322DRAFT_558472 [Thelephora terrestris]|uniref:Uncharacterized protein n=1 Tax=Thelephora terrestris TaxID=56493 RepID=A0A9P6LAI4_9AGAM|nr:hypothetical protein BJ322DRAFT_558472 [Thelephora terrestris]
MVFFTGSPAHLDFPQGLSIYDNHSIGQDQYDYPMADTFDFQFGANAGPLYGAEPENQSTPVPSAYHVYTFQHMLDYVQPPTVVPNQLPQALNSPFPSLAQNHVFSFHVPPPRGRWQFTRNPRPVRFGHHGVCPTPTSLPSVPNLTQASNYVEMMMRNGSFRAANEYNRPLFLSCDHANCNPPQNVGLLSRRFPENDRWIQARAVAVSTIPRIKTGIYSLPAEIIDMISEQFPVIDKLTSLGAGELILQTPNRYRAYLVLAATCKDLRRIFYHRACLTKAVPMRSFPVVVRLFKTPDESIHGLLVDSVLRSLAGD